MRAKYDPRRRRPGWLPDRGDGAGDDATEPFAHAPSHVDPDPVVRLYVPSRGYTSGYDCAPTLEDVRRRTS